MDKLIGRENEIRLLRQAMNSGKPELIAVYGRRRVGKTFLIRQFFNREIVFDISGIPDGSYRQQLRNFYLKLCEKNARFKKRDEPEDWLQAFTMLSEYIRGLRDKRRKVLFIDEFPWVYTPRSKFISMFAHFWNDFCSRRKDLVVVICGSSASFMINKVIRDRRGLHNRISYPIRLMPFSLHETEQYLKSRRVNLTRYDYLQLYMAIGGIPHYLEKILPGESVAIAIDRLCFKPDALLKDEFNAVFESLFENSSNHQRVVETLASASGGLNRDELVRQSGLSTGGGFTRIIRELIESGFVTEYRAFNTSRKYSVFRLSDEYSLFFLRYIHGNTDSTWTSLFNSRSYISWGGIAFESICLKHTNQIKKALGISGISSNSSTWRNKHAQIDLVIDRSDNCINLCEIKFYSSEFVINKSYRESLTTKKQEFVQALQARKNVFVTFISSFGVRENTHYQYIVDNQLTMDSLFESA